MHQSGAGYKLLIDTETAFKTAPGSPDAMVLPFVKHTIGIKQARKKSKTLIGSRNPSVATRGGKELAGDIDIELAWQYGRLLKHIFGSAVRSGAADAYTWTYTIAGLPVGMVLEGQALELAVPQYILWNGCRVNSFKGSIKADGGPCECSVAIIGAKETVGVASFDATPTDLGHTGFDTMSGVISEGGAVSAIITELSWEFANNLDNKWRCIDGTGELASLPSGEAAIKGSIKAVFDSMTLYNKALQNTTSSLSWVLSNGTGAGTAGNEKITFYVDKLKFGAKGIPVNGPEGMVVDLDYEGHFEVGDASAFRAVLLCAQETF